MIQWITHKDSCFFCLVFEQIGCMNDSMTMTIQWQWLASEPVLSRTDLLQVKMSVCIFPVGSFVNQNTSIEMNGNADGYLSPGVIDIHGGH